MLGIVHPPIREESPAANDGTGHLIVMAKPALPGRVKTRMIGRYTAQQAAAAHAAMLECVLNRTATHLGSSSQLRFVLALDDTRSPQRSGARGEADISVPQDWQVISQGNGHLGQRLAHVWQTIGGGLAIFLGADCPDLPSTALGSILPSIRSAHVAAGPVDDGGYWTLACRRYDNRLLTDIDWGTAAVYHQTVHAAQQAGFNFASLPSWYDVDTPRDLDRLRQRLAQCQEPALRRLKTRLDQICEDTG